MIRIKRSRVILALVIFGVSFWLMLYWNVSSVYARHRSQYFGLRKDVIDLALDMHTARDEDKEEAYSEAYLKRLGEIVTADDQRNYDSGIVCVL